jgi:hypothetical protein
MANLSVFGWRGETTFLGSTRAARVLVLAPRQNELFSAMSLL